MHALRRPPTTYSAGALRRWNTDVGVRRRHGPHLSHCSFFDDCLVRMADKTWLKISLVDLLFEKNNICWQKKTWLIKPSEHGGGWWRWREKRRDRGGLSTPNATSPWRARRWLKACAKQGSSKHERPHESDAQPLRQMMNQAPAGRGQTSHNK